MHIVFLMLALMFFVISIIYSATDWFENAPEATGMLYMIGGWVMFGIGEILNKLRQMR